MTVLVCLCFSELCVSETVLCVCFSESGHSQKTFFFLPSVTTHRCHGISHVIHALRTGGLSEECLGEHGHTAAVCYGTCVELPINPIIHTSLSTAVNKKRKKKKILLEFSLVPGKRCPGLGVLWKCARNHVQEIGHIRLQNVRSQCVKVCESERGPLGFPWTSVWTSRYILAGLSGNTPPPTRKSNSTGTSLSRSWICGEQCLSCVALKILQKEPT